MKGVEEMKVHFEYINTKIIFTDLCLWLYTVILSGWLLGQDEVADKSEKITMNLFFLTLILKNTVTQKS